MDFRNVISSFTPNFLHVRCKKSLCVKYGIYYHIFMFVKVCRTRPKTYLVLFEIKYPKRKPDIEDTTSSFSRVERQCVKATDLVHGLGHLIENACKRNCK